MTAALVLRTVFALAAVWLSGAALASLLGIREGRLRDVALDLAFGTSLLAFGGSLALITGARVTFAAAAVLLGAPVVIALATHRLRLNTAAHIPANAIARAFLAAAAVVLLAILTAAMHDRLTWDAWAFWTLKATMLVHDGTLPPDLFDPHGPYAYAHADYPPGLSLLQWWIMRCAGAPVAAVASLAGAIWLVPIALLFHDAVRTRVRPELAALGTLAVAAWWPIAQNATGQADVVMVLATLGITIHLAELDTGDTALWRVAAFAALAALVKNEGLALAVMVGVAVVVWLVVHRRLSVVRCLALALPVLLVLPWAVWVRAQGLQPEHLAAQVPMSALPGRAAVILRDLAALAVHRSWIAVGPIAAAAVILTLRRRAHSSLRLPLAVLALYFATLMGVYLVAPLDTAWLLETSAERVIGVMVPAAAFLALASSERDPDT